MKYNTQTQLHMRRGGHMDGRSEKKEVKKGME